MKRCWKSGPGRHVGLLLMNFLVCSLHRLNEEQGLTWAPKYSRTLGFLLHCHHGMELRGVSAGG